MHLETVRVELGARSYPIYIGAALLHDATLMQRHVPAGPIAIVSNETVAPLYLDRVRAALGERVRCIRILADGEQYKNLPALSGLFDELLDKGCDRQSTLVALGGGVVGDITGFAAATYQRGVNFIQLPTTLLAQVDSSVGGKTGVNLARGKNMIGAFHQPLCVISDIDTLQTLPHRELSAGLAEVIKYGLIADRPFYEWMRANIGQLRERKAVALIEAIKRSCECKARVVALDEREGGVRALLNFGHTFGHAIETATGYAHYLHGEAVAIGMLMATRMSARMGWLGETECAGIRELLDAAGLPLSVERGIDVEHFLALMASDKKALGGNPRLVLLRGIGEAILSADYPPQLLRSLLAAALTSERANASDTAIHV